MIALLLALISPSPLPIATPPARELMSFAFQRLASYPKPAYVVYIGEERDVVANQVPPRDEQTFSEGWRIAYRASTQTMSQVDVPAAKTLPPARVYSPPFVGPLAYPVDQESRRFGDVRPRQDDTLSTSLATIATITIDAKPDYDARVVGMETVEGRPCYHVELVPLHDPQRFDLHDLWIDRETYDLREVRYDVAFVPGAPVGERLCNCEVTVYFVAVDGYWVTAAWESRIRPGFGTSLTRVVHIAYMTFPPALPDWLFNQRDYDLQRTRGGPDLTAQILHIEP